MATKQNIPDALDLDTIQEEPKVSAPAKKAAKPATASAATAEKYEYHPSDKTIEKLNSFPKEEIKAELGLDIDNLITSAKRYGVLEGLAYGSFTTEPLPLKLKQGHQKTMNMFGTVRLYAFNDEKTGQPIWGYEVHPVKLVKKLDAEGKPVLKADGTPQLTFDRNPLEKNSILKFNGSQLSDTQVDKLRLTGRLDEPILGVNAKGETTMTLLAVDPYNHHELIAMDSSTVAKKIAAANEGVFKYKDENKEVRTVQLTDKMKGLLSQGRGVYGKDDTQKDVYIVYNIASGRLEKGISYEFAKRKEVSEKETESVQKSIKSSEKNDIAVGHKI